jgi:hypothetical protein
MCHSNEPQNFSSRRAQPLHVSWLLATSLFACRGETATMEPVSANENIVRPAPSSRAARTPVSAAATREPGTEPVAEPPIPQGKSAPALPHDEQDEAEPSAAQSPHITSQAKAQEPKSASHTEPRAPEHEVKPSAAHAAPPKSAPSKPRPIPEQGALPPPPPVAASTPPDPVPVAAPPPPPPQPKAAVNVPSTAHVNVTVPPGLQAFLDADDRMLPWLGKAVNAADECYAREREKNASAAGIITFQLTMHENARPSGRLGGASGAINGVVMCVTKRLIGVKMPLFTGTEGASYTVTVHFDP